VKERISRDTVYNVNIEASRPKIVTSIPNFNRQSERGNPYGL